MKGRTMDRYEKELDILERISQILGGGRDLNVVFQRAIAALGEQLDIQRAALLLWDAAADRLRIVAAVGLSDDEIRRGQYVEGEGVTGQVIATGRPQIIADISRHDGFLNRTGSIRISQEEKSAVSQGPTQTSFLCVPVKDGDRLIGAISIIKPLVSRPSLAADARLLTIVSGLIAQTIRIHQLVRIEKDQWLEEKRRLRDDLLGRYRFDNIIGTSPAMLDVLATIGQVASSRATCLLLAETGCGKELVAKAIHYNSPRNEKPLIRVNCGALNHHLLESELFGHVKGAFTGALRDKVGRFEAASGGTIFLDEIGTLGPQVQVKLLRVLQERELERVGDHRPVKTDVRVIAATNLDLEKEVRLGRFREDLYYRLNVVMIHLPPLRSRREDIPPLIDHFLDRYNRENHRCLRRIDPGVLGTLLRYPWPGNVRELENTVERAVVLSTGEDFTDDLLPLQIRLYASQVRAGSDEQSVQELARQLADQAVNRGQAQGGGVYDTVMGEVERQLIHVALAHHGGVKTRTADYLGINRNTLNKKVKQIGTDNER